MDLSEQLRILEAAKGDPARLALATVDLAHSDLAGPERARVRDALAAAALPHWFDVSIIGALLMADPNETQQLLARLRNLSVVEAFPARGEGAANVHEATRIALREMTRTEDAHRFRAISRRIREYFLSEGTFHLRIEALYHLFAYDQTKAAVECAVLDNEATAVGGMQAWVALGRMLAELLAEGWLEDHALLEATLSVNECKRHRGEMAGIEEAAVRVLKLAQDLDDMRGMARAQALWSDAKASQGRLEESLKGFEKAIAFLEQVVARNPDNVDSQRELNTGHSRTGDILFDARRLDEAFASYQKALVGSQTIVSKHPTNVGLLRQLGILYSKLGLVFIERGNVDDAFAAFHEHLAIVNQLLVTDPLNSDSQYHLAIIRSQLGGLFLYKQDPKSALEEFNQQLTIHKDLVQRDSTHLEWRHGLSVAFYNIGETLMWLGRREEAVEHLHEAKMILQQLVTLQPSTVVWTQDLKSIEHSLEESHRGDSSTSDGTSESKIF
jgi:tetratricopeptide (TPR) repeat protein